MEPKQALGRVAIILIVSVISGVSTLSALRKEGLPGKELGLVETAGLSPIILKDDAAGSFAPPANERIQISSASSVGVADLPLPSPPAELPLERSQSPESGTTQVSKQEGSPAAAQASAEPLESPPIVAATEVPNHRAMRRQSLRAASRRSAPVSSFASFPAPWAYNQAVGRRGTPFSYNKQLAPH